MKHILSLFILAHFACYSSAQLVAKMEMKEAIPGVCDKDEVYALFPGFKGQIQPVSAVSEEEIVRRLISQVQFVKDNPKHKDKFIVSIIINCKGEVIQCQIDNKTKSPELDEQIVAVFSELKEWKSGTLFGKPVDAVELFGMKIKKGKFTHGY